MKDVYRSMNEGWTDIYGSVDDDQSLRALTESRSISQPKDNGSTRRSLKESYLKEDTDISLAENEYTLDDKTGNITVKADVMKKVAGKDLDKNAQIQIAFKEDNGDGPYKFKVTDKTDKDYTLELVECNQGTLTEAEEGKKVGDFYDLRMKIGAEWDDVDVSYEDDGATEVTTYKLTKALTKSQKNKIDQYANITAPDDSTAVIRITYAKDDPLVVPARNESYRRNYRRSTTSYRSPAYRRVSESSRTSSYRTPRAARNVTSVNEAHRSYTLHSRDAQIRRTPTLSESLLRGERRLRASESTRAPSRIYRHPTASSASIAARSSTPRRTSLSEELLGESRRERAREIIERRRLNEGINRSRSHTSTVRRHTTGSTTRRPSIRDPRRRY